MTNEECPTNLVQLALQQLGSGIEFVDEIISQKLRLHFCLTGTISINCESTSSESAAKDGLNDVVREKVFKVSGFGVAPQVCTLL